MVPSCAASANSALLRCCAAAAYTHGQIKEVDIQLAIEPVSSGMQRHAPQIKTSQAC
jgi:hypothetical protein